jgi:hypothetical protein
VPAVEAFLMVARTTLLGLGLAAFAAVLSFALGQERAAQPQPPVKPAVDQLIERLDSNDFQTRESASRDLLDRDDAVPALRMALQSDKPEIRRRAEQILEQRRELIHQRMTERVLFHIKNGQVDQVVDQLAVMDGPVDDKVWDALLEFAQRLVAKAAKEDGMKRLHMPQVNEMRDKDPEKLRDHNTLPPHKRISDLRVVAPEVVGREAMNRNFIISQGRVEGGMGAYFDNIVFTNGDVKCPDTWMGCLIVCDGNITLDGGGSVVFIATGTIKEDCGACVRQKTREAYGMVKFYDTKQAGVEAADADGRVVVKKVVDGLPFARAGFLPGDCILAADGKKVGGFDEFRRLLRRNSMANKETVFKVRRGERDLELTVQLADY